jgi:hypothetical protein
MRPVTIRRAIALLLLMLLLAGTIWFGPLVKQMGSRFGFYSFQEWIHAFCLTQTVLLAAAAVYGPGRLVVRLPLLCAWALAIGFGLATLNLVSSDDRASLASGAILLSSGVLGPLMVFTLHRWRTEAWIAIGNGVANRVAGRSVHQLSLQVLMILIAAFAVAGIVARRTIFAPPDPLGSEHDVHVRVVQIWLGLFLCLAAAPMVLVVFRPSWKIVFAVAFFIAITWANPRLLGLADPYVFPDRFRTTYLEVAMESFQWHCQAAIAVLIYTMLARLAGFRMVFPNQATGDYPARASRGHATLPQ